MRFIYEKGVVRMANWAENIYERILAQAGLTGARITSTKRTPQHQAEVMYSNLDGPGDRQQYIDRQLRLYGDNGDRVIRVFQHQMEMGATRGAVIQAMTKEIIAIGPEKVSAHCVNDPAIEVFDTAPSSIPEAKRPVYEGVVRHSPCVAAFIPYPTDPAYHIKFVMPRV